MSDFPNQPLTQNYLMSFMVFLLQIKAKFHLILTCRIDKYNIKGTLERNSLNNQYVYVQKANNNKINNKFFF